MNIYLSISYNEYNEMPYGRTDSFIIETSDEDEARKLVYDEDDDEYKSYWLDAGRTNCEPIEVINHSKIHSFL